METQRRHRGDTEETETEREGGSEPQPLFGLSVGSLCHLYITTTHSPIGFLYVQLPPPPCAVILILVLGSILHKFRGTKRYWEVLCASVVVQSSMGSTLQKSSSTNQHCEVPCANFVVQSNTGKYFLQTL